MPVFKKIYPPETLKTELEQIMEAAENECDGNGVPKDISISDILGTKEMRLALIAGVGMQASVLCVRHFLSFRI